MGAALSNTTSASRKTLGAEMAKTDLPALATTDPQKVLPTLRSRTQHFEFTLLSHGQLVGHLADILGREGIETDPDEFYDWARDSAAVFALQESRIAAFSVGEAERQHIYEQAWQRGGGFAFILFIFVLFIIFLFRAVKNTEQITKAMKMVAASKLRRTTGAICA